MEFSAEQKRPPAALAFSRQLWRLMASPSSLSAAARRQMYLRNYDGQSGPGGQRRGGVWAESAFALGDRSEADESFRRIDRNPREIRVDGCPASEPVGYDKSSIPVSEKSLAP